MSRTITQVILVALIIATNLAHAETLVLENFEGSKLDWSSGNSKNGKTDYYVEKEGTNSFLRGHFLPDTDGKPIHRTVRWNTDKFPYLQWRWRVNRFPKGAKVQVDGKRDAAAQIYVVWKIGGRGYSLKYIWAESDPVGLSFGEGRWNPIGRLFSQVIRSGGATATWQTETRNVRQDFEKAFDKKPPAEAEGIGVLTDGDGTKTEPEGDYDDFTALTAP
ncbi:MAG: DUF3047 domain-containing protein [Bdellovibrionales bacterium]|nr:DUF3047 domain-containing protein [Bdellovibrionales bacterium]